MKSPWIRGLRSVALTVPDLAAAEARYIQFEKQFGGRVGLVHGRQPG